MTFCYIHPSIPWSIHSFIPFFICSSLHLSLHPFITLYSHFWGINFKITCKDPNIGLPRWCNGKESTCQCRRRKRCGFNPWVRKIPWSRKWQLAPVFLLGKFHGQRRLLGYSPWGHRESDITDHIHEHSEESFPMQPPPPTGYKRSQLCHIYMWQSWDMKIFVALLGDEVIGPRMLLHQELKTDTKFQLQASENKTVIFLLSQSMGTLNLRTATQFLFHKTQINPAVTMLRQTFPMENSSWALVICIVSFHPYSTLIKIKLSTR